MKDADAIGQDLCGHVEIAGFPTDESGVVVLKPATAESYARRAIEMQEQELVLLERLRKGEKLPDISGATKLVESKRA